MIEEMNGDFLQWLRGFYYVSKRRSVSAAVNDMKRNQPTISHQIKCLEKQFGVTLFDRSGGVMQLTYEGKMFLNNAISIFEIIKEMKNEINKKDSHFSGEITIASTHTVIQYILPPFIKSFREKSPNVCFTLEGGMHDMVIEKVESAEADFGIVNIETEKNNIRYCELYDTSLSLIQSKEDRFALGDKPSMKAMSKVPFISFPESAQIYPFIRGKFAEKKLGLNVVLIVNNFQAIKKYVSLGIGISILDANMVVEEDKKVLNVVNLDHIFNKRKYRLILRKGKYLSPAVKAFVKSIKPGLNLD